MMMRREREQVHGPLYDSRFEHDNCGIGAREGMEFMGWREVPVRRSVLGCKALAQVPHMMGAARRKSGGRLFVSIIPQFRSSPWREQRQHLSISA